MADRVRLRGPSGDEWDCPAAAVDGWKELGWTEVSASRSLSGKNKAELQEYAAEHGIDLGEATTKADILAAIENSEV